jgi:hypothetical protein
LSSNRLSRLAGALALGAIVAGCGVTPTIPATTTSSTSAVTSTTTAPVTTTTALPAPIATAPVVQQAPAAPPPRTTATKRTTTTTHQASSCSGGYINVDGNCVPRPTSADSAPAGATAHCKDGTYSFSQHRQGTCSHHGGVLAWL